VKFKAKEITLEDGRRGQSTVHGETQSPLTLLFSITAVVLLIACANIANLLLARAAGRTTEMAVRLSLGATRRQLLAQLLTESVLLALLGGIVSLFVAHLTLGLLAGLLPSARANAMHFELRTNVVLFAAALSLGTGFLFGLFPALQSTRPDLVSTLRAGAGKLAGARTAARFCTSLVTAQIPGADAVAEVAILRGSSSGNDVNVQGFEGGPDVNMNSRVNAVGPGYFRTLGEPVLSGREFTAADVAGAPLVALVNEAFAKKFNLGRDAVGKFMSFDRKDSLNVQIVGLIKDAKYPGVISRLDPNLPVERLTTMTVQVKENVYLDRMISILSAAFAALATLLAAVGLYGVLAYSVAQRTREIGVRMALGADAGSVRMMVLRQVGFMTLIGTTTGIAVALAVGRAAKSPLFQLDGNDPLVFIASAVALALVALGAGYLPARRASRVDPMQALRYE
ncbi:MAG TPA: FtsX-like permease family protein, partial [Gemmatimonadaceae bacterium]|nr:FtsX-like permease family protein [Gemmatimonadaceae bacterium]